MRTPSPRHIVLALLLAASVVFLWLSLRSTGSRQAAESERQEREAAAAAPTHAEKPLAPAAREDVGFDRYAKLAQADVFSETRAAPPPPPKSSAPLPPPPLPKGEQPAPAPKVDFSDWSYMGYVELDGEKLGLLQNETTHTCRFLAVGESFMGATVEELDREDIRLRVGTSRTTLSRPRDFSVTPLDPGASAPKTPRPQR